MQRIMKTYVPVIVFTALLLSGGCINSFLYYPVEKIKDTPASINLKFKEYTFPSSSGNRIHSWWVPSDPHRYTVLFFHGNGGNISHRLMTLKMLNEMKLNVFIFDYSGYGKSEGVPGEKETYRDARAAWKFLTGDLKIDPASIIIWGRSLGGAVAVELAVSKKFAALIMESSFSTLEKVVSDHTSPVLRPFGAGGKYRSIDQIRKVKVPVCIIHSRDDEVIPYYHGKLLFAAAGEPKEFITIAGSHNRGFYKSRNWYISKVNKFLNSLSHR